MTKASQALSDEDRWRLSARARLTGGKAPAGDGPPLCVVLHSTCPRWRRLMLGLVSAHLGAGTGRLSVLDLVALHPDYMLHREDDSYQVISRIVPEAQALALEIAGDWTTQRRSFVLDLPIGSKDTLERQLRRLKSATYQVVLLLEKPPSRLQGFVPWSMAASEGLVPFVDITIPHAILEIPGLVDAAAVVDGSPAPGWLRQGPPTPTSGLDLAIPGGAEGSGSPMPEDVYERRRRLLESIARR